ncbi:MAG: pentapeptide repeat-containing protein [Desertifilum sp.]|nr:pentapeptide repeat-containing protein [Oscillatoria laete-virens]MCD8489932.1 pentapeptide repeat-containing protein [Desertifilum sp.]MDI9641808.1 pentapeptide repeat-containing protein [Geitlerinema splendidum]MDL5052406.1 pentapeptide repeat-containing protein [Oscillatoria laete-virens NRMC-F 0139]
MTLSDEISFIQENRCSDYLLMEVLATPNGQQLDLYLNLSFLPTKETLGEGNATVELNGGQLELQLTQGKFLQGSSLETPQFTATFVSGEAPTWIFQPKVTPHLHGRLDKAYFASIEVENEATEVSLTFTISPENIQIAETEGLWPHSIAPNLLAVVERKIALMLFEIKLQPYLSQVTWMLKAPEESSILAAEVHLPDTALIRTTIRTLLTAETDNFLELAKLADLEPTQDFAGARLLGVDLRNLDLAEANFQGTYLRGADLCDTDLSDADLSGANLAGADLSGAYLSNANLQGADLHRASLALANLSGANLQGANLQQANLSQANLSDTNLREANLSEADLTGVGIAIANLTDTVFAGTKVERARFQDNTGLTEAMKLELMKRGAIFDA